jgi:hypothetical protein
VPDAFFRRLRFFFWGSAFRWYDFFAATIAWRYDIFPLADFQKADRWTSQGFRAAMMFLKHHTKIIITVPGVDSALRVLSYRGIRRSAELRSVSASDRPTSSVRVPYRFGLAFARC